MAEEVKQVEAAGVQVATNQVDDVSKKAIYILQIKQEKFTEESMKVLKCLLLHIVRTSQLQHIIVEVHFDEEQYSPFESHLELILKMLVTGYNLTEPEHSRSFPLVKIDILLP